MCSDIRTKRTWQSWCSVQFPVADINRKEWNIDTVSSAVLTVRQRNRFPENCKNFERSLLDCVKSSDFEERSIIPPSPLVFGVDFIPDKTTEMKTTLHLQKKGTRRGCKCFPVQEHAEKSTSTFQLHLVYMDHQPPAEVVAKQQW